MNKFLFTIFIIIGLYGLLSWAADNPRSISNLHQKVDDTVISTVDKGERAAFELTK